LHGQSPAGPNETGGKANTPKTKEPEEEEPEGGGGGGVYSYSADTIEGPTGAPAADSEEEVLLSPPAHSFFIGPTVINIYN